MAEKLIKGHIYFESKKYRVKQKWDGPSKFVRVVYERVKTRGVIWEAYFHISYILRLIVNFLFCIFCMQKSISLLFGKSKNFFWAESFLCVRIHFLFVRGRFGLALEGTKTGGCGHLESSKDFKAKAFS